MKKSKLGISFIIGVLIILFAGIAWYVNKSDSPVSSLSAEEALHKRNEEIAKQEKAKDDAIKARVTSSKMNEGWMNYTDVENKVSVDFPTTLEVSVCYGGPKEVTDKTYSDRCTSLNLVSNTPTLKIRIHKPLFMDGANFYSAPVQNRKTTSIKLDDQDGFFNSSTSAVSAWTKEEINGYKFILTIIEPNTESESLLKEVMATVDFL
jgi:hypothetical protein